MKNKLLSLAVALLGFAAAGFAQGKAIVLKDSSFVVLDNTIAGIPEETTNLTFEAWVKPDTTKGFKNWAGVVFLRDDVDFTSASGINVGEYKPDTLPIFWTWNDIYWVETGANYSINKWQHVAVVVSEQSVKTFKNGKLVHTWIPSEDPDYEGDVVPAENWTGKVTIGKDRYHETWTGRTWKGGIDEVRIWNKSLTDEEVAATWNKELKGSETDLAAYYNFKTVVGSIVTNGGVGPTATIMHKSNTEIIDGQTPVGVKDKELLEGVDAYAVGTKLFVNNSNQNAELTVTNVMGQTIAKQTINGNTQLTLAEGNVYIVTVVSNNKAYATKVLID